MGGAYVRIHPAVSASQGVGVDANCHGDSHLKRLKEFYMAEKIQNYRIIVITLF
jgi:hypothetical protein